MTDIASAQPVWLRAHEVRIRFARMPHSTFYARLKKHLLPAAEYPFGPRTPLWRLSVIEDFERKTLREAA